MNHSEMRRGRKHLLLIIASTIALASCKIETEVWLSPTGSGHGHITIDAGPSSKDRELYGDLLKSFTGNRNSGQNIEEGGRGVDRPPFAGLVWGEYIDVKKGVRKEDISWKGIDRTVDSEGWTTVDLSVFFFEVDVPYDQEGSEISLKVHVDAQIDHDRTTGEILPGGTIFFSASEIDGAVLVFRPFSILSRVTSNLSAPFWTGIAALAGIAAVLVSLLSRRRE